MKILKGELQAQDESVLYPYTSTDCVFDENGKTIDEKNLDFVNRKNGDGLGYTDARNLTGEDLKPKYYFKTKRLNGLCVQLFTGEQLGFEDTALYHVVTTSPWDGITGFVIQTATRTLNGDRYIRVSSGESNWKDWVSGGTGAGGGKSIFLTKNIETKKVSTATQGQKVYEIPFENFDRVTCFLEVHIKSTWINPDRYTFGNNQITLDEGQDLGTDVYFTMYELGEVDGNGGYIQDVDVAETPQEVIIYDASIIDEKVNEHNVNGEAHQDIRQLIGSIDVSTDVENALVKIVNSDKTTPLNTLINNVKNVITTAITTAKDAINSHVTSTGTNINSHTSAVAGDINKHTTNTAGTVNTHTTNESTRAITAVNAARDNIKSHVTSVMGSSGVVKSIQRGIGFAPTLQPEKIGDSYSLNYFDVTISAVNMSKSFVIANSVQENVNGWARLINSTTLRINIGNTGDGYAWQVIEFN